jgi:hypothetical protein
VLMSARTRGHLSTLQAPWELFGVHNRSAGGAGVPFSYTNTPKKQEPSDSPDGEAASGVRGTGSRPGQSHPRVLPGATAPLAFSPPDRSSTQGAPQYWHCSAHWASLSFSAAPWGSAWPGLGFTAWRGLRPHHWVGSVLAGGSITGSAIFAPNNTLHPASCGPGATGSSQLTSC